MKQSFNFSMYFCGWWIAIFGGNAPALVALFAILVSHFTLWRDPRDIFVILVFIFAGFLVEWGFMASGTLNYHSGLPPVWVICMWAMLATVLRHSLFFLFRHPLPAFAVGLVAAPLVYATSVYFGPAEWSRPPWQSALIVSLVWGPLAALIGGVLLPCIERLDAGERGVEGPSVYT